MPDMKPILFNTSDVRAILEGRKTVTRRVVKPKPVNVMTEEDVLRRALSGDGYYGFFIGTLDTELLKKAPYQPGQTLYVRETWQNGFGGAYLYKASAGLDLFMTPEGELVSDIPWRPSIHMPREAARLFLRVTDVRVERLQDITEEQALLEGIPESGSFPLDNPAYCPECKGEGTISVHDYQTLGHMDVDCPYCNTPIKRFANFWDATLKPTDRARYGWEANPWVWVIGFERISREDAT